MASTNFIDYVKYSAAAEREEKVLHIYTGINSPQKAVPTVETEDAEAM